MSLSAVVVDEGVFVGEVLLAGPAVELVLALFFEVFGLPASDSALFPFVIEIVF